MSDWIKKDSINKVILQKTITAPTPESLDIVTNEFRKDHKVIATIPSHVLLLNQQIVWLATLFYESKE